MDTQLSINQRFAKVVDELLSKNRIGSQAELAQKLGYKSKSSITGMIKGSQSPSIENIADLRTQFGVSINYMIRGELPMFAADKKATPEPPKPKELPTSETSSEYLYRTIIEMQKEMMSTKDQVIKVSSDVSGLKNEMKVSFERLQNLLGGISDSQMLVSKFLVRQIAALTKQAPNAVLKELDRTLSEGQK